MTDNEELTELLQDLESDRVERKASLSDKEKIRQAICSFANDLPNHRKPGVIFIGANDDGTCAHLPITDDLLLQIADMKTDGNILPLPMMTVQKRTLAGGEVVVVEVQPSDYPPVRYKGCIWLRVGPRRAIATPDEERRLSEKRAFKNLPFDQQPAYGATLAEIDLDFFKNSYLPHMVDREILKENNRDLEDQLKSCRLMTPDGSAPTLAGVLLTGLAPQTWLPGAYVQFVRFDGLELSDPILNDQTIKGNLNDQVEMAKKLIAVNVTRPSKTGDDFQRKETPDYPELALRELVLNALIHRSYESTNAPVMINWFLDRVEIQNPGGLFGRVTPETFGRVGDYRNPTLAEGMKALGWVEKFGVGVQRVRKLLKDNGNPEPEFDFASGANFFVVVHKAGNQ